MSTAGVASGTLMLLSKQRSGFGPEFFTTSGYVNYEFEEVGGRKMAMQ